MTVSDVETTTETTTETTEQGHWSEQYGDAFGGDEKMMEHLRRYDSPEDALRGGFEARRTLGSSFRVPEDPSGLTDEQKAELFARVRKLKNVPDEPGGYEIQRPENLPAGLGWDDAMEEGFKQFAHERGMAPDDVQALMDFYTESRIAAHNAAVQKQQKDVNRAVREFKAALAAGGQNYDQALEGIHRLRLHVAQQLGLTYTNDDGTIGSTLDDALDAIGADGTALGNRAPILQMMHWLAVNYLDEGGVGGPGSPAAAGKDFFDYKGMDKDS